ncbi:MAG: YHS domain-containing protein [Actinobacteria bacterium]|nr:YHS domain-containing protein [Actinomycetota bacterium]
MSASDGIDVMELAVDLARYGQSFAMATVVWRKPPSSGQHGSRAVITAEGILHGWIGGACAEPVVIREAKRVIEAGTPSLIWLGQPEDFEGMHVPAGVVTVPMSCQSEGALQLFIEPVLVAPEVIVVGRSPMAMTLLDLVRGIGWRGEIVDGSDFTAASVNPSSVVVVATQGHGDEEAVEAAVAGDPAFVGLVASRKRGEVVLGFLTDRGVPAERIARVRVPVGLDLGHTTHREIAVAILAELVQLRASGAFAGRRTLLPVVEPAQVTDLVCGMTVAAVPANRPFEYQGTTYYFCAMGCRVAFEKDPESFIHQEVPC